MAGQLEGKVAWITGSSRGLGRVMASELFARGANVVVHGTRQDSPKTFGEGESMQQVAEDIADDRRVEGVDNETMAVWGDVTIPSEVTRIANEIRNQWKKIDILICCAGGDIGAKGTGVGKGGRPENDDCLNISNADMQSVMDRNLTSTFYCCREVAPEMMERKEGRIITIGSVAGCYGRATGSMYAVAKAAVHEYTRCLAEQLKPYNIPVNCIAPGPTVTQRFIRINPIDEERLVEQGTLDRYGRPIETATAVAFLCSSDAQFISGQIIRVDGGFQTFPA